MIIYQAKDSCRTTYDPASRIMVATWWNMLHEHIRPNLERQMEQVLAGALYLVIDVGDCRGVPAPEDQAWFGDTVFPTYRSAGLKAMINVVPKSGVTRLGASRWQRTATQFGFETFDAGDLPAALDLIAERYGVRGAPEVVSR